VRIRSLAHLLDVLEARFLTRENKGARFVAWNGNNFDVYLIALALLRSSDYVLKPYLTRSKALRGLKVIERGRAKPCSWEFLDAAAMTGLAGRSLDDFLATFAPAYRKLDAPDWEREEFDPANPEHVRYAERDAEGLYHGLLEAARIVREIFGEELRPTIGNLGIRIFQAHLPANVEIWPVPFAVRKALRASAMRGGYCWRARRYEGPIWKYDLNQAYAAAMREAKLPAGRCFHSSFRLNPYASVYIARVTANNDRNIVPFYVRTVEGESLYAVTEIPECWLTSIEVEQLRAEGWRIEIRESYFWDDHFSARELVDKLERLRASAPGGPNGATGTMIKMIGNNAYGKTVEHLDGVEYVMALERPEGFSDYQDGDGALPYIWYRLREPQFREYHQPQIGAFITSHVRMVIRRAILQAPDAWLYADTDCVVFDRPVALPIDPARYGAFKIEEAGTEFWIIGKKVYASADGRVKHAKGMNVRKLSLDELRAWLRGQPPEQEQAQRRNLLKVLAGEPMFTRLRKVGE
ncbi:MAG: hypothetical protein NZM12_06360, partial [Steroidobacteraceae bacterium]|nr:hypothetical protein [Steroidobacteraceae bacterium]